MTDTRTIRWFRIETGQSGRREWIEGYHALVDHGCLIIEGKSGVQIYAVGEWSRLLEFTKEEYELYKKAEDYDFEELRRKMRLRSERGPA